MNDTKIASKAKAQLAHFMGKVFAAPPDGAGGFVWPEGAFRVRRCGVALQGSMTVRRTRRGEASSREAARLY